MKVAALTIGYPPQRLIGSEMATHAMLRHLVDAGHDVTVGLTSNKHTDPWDIDGVHVDPTSAFLAIAHDADIVITHVDIAKRRLRGITAPIVGITHNGRGGVRAGLKAWNWALVVHNAETTANELAAARRCPHIVVTPPVDWREYAVDRTGADAITLVNVTGEKGSDTFYELAHRMPDRRFLGVVGGWGSPDVRDFPNVEIRPHGTDMRAVYADTRTLLLASEHESWGRVAVEAMSSGIPVVATDLPGPRECVGAAGRFVELNWWDEFERQIVELDDPATYETLSAAATARARELDPRPQLALFTQAIEDLATA